MSTAMIRQSIQSAALLIAAFAAGCSSHSNGPTTQENGEEITRATAPVIVEIVSRDSRVTVRSTPTGPTYSVTSATGEVLVPQSTLTQLQARDPQLAQQIRIMNASTAGNTAWAGVE